MFRKYNESIRSGWQHVQHLLHSGDLLLDFRKIVLIVLAYSQGLRQLRLRSLPAKGIPI
jgi:hypothetical protein